MIRYAGVETLLPSPKVEAFVNANLPAGIAQYFCPPGNGAELGESAPFMPANKWAHAVQPRINTLYWPTGASRWACMLLLVDSSMLDTIVPLTSAAFSAGLYNAVGKQLVLADTGYSGTITDDEWSLSSGLVAMSTEMFALTPHPISAYSGASKTLWVLPVVDARWFWQWEPVVPGVDAPADWDETLNLLRDTIRQPSGLWIPDDIETEYSEPLDLRDYKHATLGKAIDAACRLIGHRFVRTVKQTCRTYRFGTANTRWTANTVDADGPTAFGTWTSLAGGEFTYRAAATMPEKLLIGGAAGTEEVTTQSAGATAWANWYAALFVPTTSTAGAHAFADRFAADWVGWRSNKKADQSFIGVKAWDTCGYEDFVIISMGNLHENTMTRIVTLPENFGIEDWTQAGTATSEPNLIYNKLLGEGGPDDVTFDWEFVKISDLTVMASGSYALGDSFAAIKATIDAAVGASIPFIGLGPWPGNELEIHGNQPFGEDRYLFQISNIVVTPVTDGWAYVKCATCRTPGG